MALSQEWVYSLDNIEEYAKRILTLCKKRYFFAFYGNIGSGKTTMIKTMCELLGSEDDFSSPTYALVNEYSLPSHHKKQKIYHIDLYRLNSPEEALDIDIESYFYDDAAYVFVEWPEMVEKLFPDHAIALHFSKKGPLERTIKLSEYE